VCEHAPVRPELVTHHDARDDAHAERDGERPHEMTEEGEGHRAAGCEPQTLEHREITREPDRQRRKHDVECDRETELNTREQQSIDHQGRYGNAPFRGVRSGATRCANAQSSGRVFRGSMISSTMNASAVRNGERTLLRRSVMSRISASGSATPSSIDL